jgi:hypothetical protein
VGAGCTAPREPWGPTGPTFHRGPASPQDPTSLQFKALSQMLQEGLLTQAPHFFTSNDQESPMFEFSFKKFPCLYLQSFLIYKKYHNGILNFSFSPHP